MSPRQIADAFARVFYQGLLPRAALRPLKSKRTATRR
jgi:hypothetical protein